MMTAHTKRTLDAAISELKRDGFMVLLVMFDQKKDESNPMGTAVEVLCSESNDPAVLAAMAKDALTEMARPIQFPGQEIIH